MYPLFGSICMACPFPIPAQTLDGMNHHLPLVLTTSDSFVYLPHLYKLYFDYQALLVDKNLLHYDRKFAWLPLDHYKPISVE